MTASRITDQLYVGDIQDAREAPTDRFDRVVTVCQDEVSDNVGCAYNWFNMSDGPENSYGGDSSYELFAEAADCVLASLDDGETVLVHCHMGQSRSVAVAAAALAVFKQAYAERGFEWVRQGRGQTHPDHSLRLHAIRYADENRR